MFDGEYLNWTTDGANAGTVFYRRGKFNVTNVCGLLEVNPNIALISQLYIKLDFYTVQSSISTGRVSRVLTTYLTQTSSSWFNSSHPDHKTPASGLKLPDTDGFLFYD